MVGGLSLDDQARWIAAVAVGHELDPRPQDADTLRYGDRLEAQTHDLVLRAILTELQRAAPEAHRSAGQALLRVVRAFGDVREHRERLGGRLGGCPHPEHAGR